VNNYAEGISEHFSRVMIDRMPEPALMRFALDVTPHLVQFGLVIFNFLNINNNFMWL
jgi:hypothetical protein